MLINLPFGRKPNAFALGVPVLNVIAVTKGGNTTWSEGELAGVLAHERGHINQFHTLVRVAVVFFFVKKQNAAETREEKMKILVARMATMNVLTFVMERLADRSAQRQGFGPQLASALSNTHHNRFTTVMSLLSGGYHPATAGRIKRLNK